VRAEALPAATAPHPAEGSDRVLVALRHDQASDLLGSEQADPLVLIGKRRVFDVLLRSSLALAFHRVG
jgi:hypothetical protein